uniref:Transmembrane protein 186 n=1 Tax=Rhodnius prolixus TaxID=13249 RepID=T1I0Q2_RHOPR
MAIVCERLYSVRRCGNREELMENFLVKIRGVRPFGVSLLFCRWDDQLIYGKMVPTTQGQKMALVVQEYIQSGLPQITLCSVLNKFKRLQLVAATTSIPGSFIANYFNVCDPSLPTVVTTIALASTVAIFSIGQLCTELIGYVYFSEDKQEVKLAYLDYWGRRKEAIYGVEDFLPLTNSPRFPSDFLFRRLYLYNSRHPFKLSLKYGKIVDEDSFKTVFCHELE